jgi:hypothetical protein
MINDISERGEKYLNPFTDFGFKKLFGTEQTKQINLLHFKIPQ